MMFLADLGAEIVKIEDPSTGGDEARRVPPFADPAANDGLYYQSFNRGTRSLTLNLRHPEGRALLHRLVARADAVYNNLRGDLPATLGLDYGALRHANPRIVCCALNGLRAHRTAPRRAGLRLPPAGLRGIHERHGRARRAADQVRRLDRGLLRRHPVGARADDRAAPRAGDRGGRRRRGVAPRHRAVDAELHGRVVAQPRLAADAAPVRRPSEPGAEPELSHRGRLARHHGDEGEVLGAAGRVPRAARARRRRRASGRSRIGSRIAPSSSR